MADIPPVFPSAEGEVRFMAAYDAILADWPVPHESLMLPTRLGKTHVIASGPKDAPAIFLLPSLAATATLWRPNVAALSEHFRVYAVDTIGQVGKSIPDRRIKTREEMAGWLTDLQDVLDVRRAHFVGESYGGFLALNQAALMPERVDRVVLISPAATFVGFSWKFYYTMMVAGPIRKLLRGKRAATALPGGMKLAPSGWGMLMSIVMAESARPNLANPIVFKKADLAEVRSPVLLLIGEQETLYDPASTIALAKQRLPGLIGAVIPGANHLANMSAPKEVNAQILAFLRAG